jgi:hypothetical protein
MGIPARKDAPAPEAAQGQVTHVRGSLLLSSMLSLTERGFRDAYLRELPPQLQSVIPSVVAGEWIAMDIARAHYEACDRLPLTANDVYEIGATVAKRMTSGIIGTLVRISRAAGVTPGTQLDHYPRIWERLMKGGAVAVTLRGPKEVRLELRGMPLSSIPYYRYACRGTQYGMFSLFATKVYVTEVPALCTPSALGYRIAWV